MSESDIMSLGLAMKKINLSAKKYSDILKSHNAQIIISQNNPGHDPKKL